MWLEIMSFRLFSQLVHNEGLMHTRMATILIICFPSLLTYAPSKDMSNSHSNVDMDIFQSNENNIVSNAYNDD